MAAKTAHKSGALADRALISVEFDRAIVQVIGDEHYPQSDYIFTELAANAYDADATEVRFAYTFSDEGGLRGGYQLVVEDNGDGMDLAGLREYFRFGSPKKRVLGLSPRFKRPLLGQFGLGKVSALKASDHWFLETEHEGVRYFVDVDFGAWVASATAPQGKRLEGFTVERRPAQGKNGTRIELVGVRLADFREDRIVRAIRKLPLGSKFNVFLNGRHVPPRVWDKKAYEPINEEIEYVDDEGKPRTGRVTGGVYLSGEPLALEEGTKRKRYELTLDAALADDPRGRFAGIEVRVRGAMITREFFGRETHAHGVNYLWGYVNADWLPVVANRTDYVRDSPEGQAFSSRMEEVFGRIYIKWRKQRDKDREEQRRKEREEAAKAASAVEDDGRSAPADEEPTRDERGAVEAVDARELARASRVVEGVSSRLQRYFEREPGRLPFLGAAPIPRKGRPFEKLIRPLLEFQAVEDEKGDDEEAEQFDFALARREVEGTFLEPKPRRRVARRALRHVERAAGNGGRARTVVQPVKHAPLKIELSGGDLPTDDAYRWEVQPKGAPLLIINANHPLHLAFIERSGAAYEAYLGLLIALAFAEKRWNVVHRQGVADYVLELATEASRPVD